MTAFIFVRLESIYFLCSGALFNLHFTFVLHVRSGDISISSPSFVDWSQYFVAHSRYYAQYLLIFIPRPSLLNFPLPSAAAKALADSALSLMMLRIN